MTDSAQTRPMPEAPTSNRTSHQDFGPALVCTMRAPTRERIVCDVVNLICSNDSNKFGSAILLNNYKHHYYSFINLYCAFNKFNLQ